MSRLCTLLLLYRAGYTVGKYISLEKLIADSKETYYEALAESSQNWHEGTNDYAPFVRYLLGVIVAAYRAFDDRLKLLKNSGNSKSARIRELIHAHVGKITKSEIITSGQLVLKCPTFNFRTTCPKVPGIQLPPNMGGSYSAFSTVGSTRAQLDHK